MSHVQNDDFAGENATCNAPKVSWAGIDDILVMPKVCFGAENGFLAVPKVPWVGEDGLPTVPQARGDSRHGFGTVQKVWGRIRDAKADQLLRSPG